MKHTEFPIDAETFKQTALRFAAKRRIMGPGDFEMLAKDVFEHLANKPSRLAQNAAFTVRDDSLSAFCNALLQPGPDAAIEFIRERRAEGVTTPSIYLGYITAAARPWSAMGYWRPFFLRCHNRNIAPLLTHARIESRER